MYAMVCSRPDLAYSPRQEHWNAIKGVLRYVKGKLDYGLEYDKFTDHFCIDRYTDFDFAKDREFWRSIFAYIFTVCGNCVCWMSKL